MATLHPYGDGKVLKLYRAGFGRETAEREAHNAGVAFAAGSQTPAVYEVITIAGRPGIVFDRVNGVPLAFLMFVAKAQAAEHMAIMAKFHADLHTLCGDGLPSLQERLTHKIQTAGLPDDLSTFALSRLAELCQGTAGNALCHGDFHPLNILIENGNLEAPVIVDWMDATSGPPRADVARAELILRYSALPTTLPQTELDWLAHERDNLAEMYINAYCAGCSVEREQIAAWLPVVAAARRHDHIPEFEKEKMLEIVVEAKREI